jgi:hypothetical protein
MAIDGDDLYVAGHTAPPGRYRRVEPPDGRTVDLERGEVLPGSLDGHVALYVRVPAVPEFLRREAAQPSERRHMVGSA